VQDGRWKGGMEAGTGWKETGNEKHVGALDKTERVCHFTPRPYHFALLRIRQNETNAPINPSKHIHPIA